jgi:hypothetical protein
VARFHIEISRNAFISLDGSWSIIVIRRRETANPGNNPSRAFHWQADPHRLT